MTAGPTCPSCHIPVLAGYAKCPKCHSLLPYSRSKRAGTIADSGGTVAERKQSPLIPIAVAVLVAGGIIAFFGLRGGGTADEPKPVVPATATAPAPPPQPTRTSPPAQPQPLVAPESPRPGRSSAVPDLEKALRTQRLWSTIQVIGDRIDVRSATCGDPAMGPTVESAKTALRGAGLTRLRCLEESGVVVFERAL